MTYLFWIFTSTFAAAAASGPSLDFRTEVAQKVLNGEQAAELAPELPNPSTRAWVIENRWEWGSEESQLRVTATLHLRGDSKCHARAEKEARAAVRNLRAFAESHLPVVRALAQSPYQFRKWTESLRLQWSEQAGKGATPCLMQEPEPKAEKPTLLARAPMRLWGGVPSVRATLSAGGVAINGHFLIDWGAAQSSVSPLFLDFQGIPIDWFVDPDRQARVLPWTFRYDGEGLSSDEGQADRLEVAGLTLPPRYFRIVESEIADLPRSPGPCCDGVIGIDAMRSYPMEWRMEEPYELLIWKREGFHPGADFVSVAIEEKAPGVLMSPACHVQNDSHKKKFTGVRWITGLSGALEFTVPHAVAAQLSGAWKLNCQSGGNNITLAQSSSRSRAAISSAHPPKWSGGAHFVEIDKNPPVAAGDAILLRGRVILDLPHGKLWFHRQGIEAPVAAGDLGGKLEYRIIDGERSLWWTRSQTASAPLESLWQASSDSAAPLPPLSKAVRIHRINGKDPSGLDLSVVERVFWGLGQNAGAALDRGKLEIVWGNPQVTSRWKARSSSQH